MFETIRLEVGARGIARLILACPDRHNVLSAQMMDDIMQALARIDSDPEIRVVILQGEGRSFCAGGDLKWMLSQIETGPVERAAAARKLAHMLQALNICARPVIGRVHGNAFGGGIGMIAVTDVSIAAQGATFALTETKLGLTPATISPYVIARMGEAKARRVFMNARVFDAEEARELGLLARVVAPADLDAAILAEAESYLACAPGAVTAAKRLARDLGPRIDEAVIEHTVSALVTRWESGESREGIRAFLEKRDPFWKT